MKSFYSMDWQPNEPYRHWLITSCIDLRSWSLPFSLGFDSDFARLSMVYTVQFLCFRVGFSKSMRWLASRGKQPPTDRFLQQRNEGS